MKIGWHRKSDAELIRSIRFWERVYSRASWAIWGFMILGGLFFLWLILSDLAIALPEKALPAASLKWRPYAIGYATGFMGGLILGSGMANFVLGLSVVLTEIRRDRLLLAYHDRLEQAGLLPLEPAATMKPSDPNMTRS